MGIISKINDMKRDGVLDFFNSTTAQAEGLAE